MWVAADGQDLVPGQQWSVELQTKVTESSRRFHNHGEGPSRGLEKSSGTFGNLRLKLY